MGNKEKKIVSSGYDKVAEKYLAMRNENLKEMEFVPEFIEKVLENRVGGKVLDAGCGAGVPFTKKLSEAFEVIGIDISEKQLEIAQELVPEAQFQCKDMVSLDFPDKFFDGIFSYYAIIHVPREEHKSILQSFYRMLNSGGIMLISMGSKDDLASYEEDFFGEKIYWSGFDTKTNVQMIKDCGFEIIWIMNIDDSLGDSFHPFILAQKVEKQNL